MCKNLVSKLKPWVTTFSEAIRHKYSHGDEICVGGEILRIFDTINFTDRPDFVSIIQVDIDDHVGPITLLVPTEIYSKYKEKYHLKIGDIIVAEGKVYDPYNTLKDDKRDTPTLLCWFIKPLDSQRKEG